MSDPRRRYLVCYDIANPKRLRQVAKLLESYGTRLQYSVFECPLDDLRLEQAKADLRDTINADQDQVLFVSLGPEANDATLIIATLGLPYTVRSRVTII
ncbi:CRISPR-associated protein Cas2 [Opitutaceae bacterium TAV5]|nr:CRISPR-associated protein Cas2 [Opitutaceae bacterium TAV5]